MNILDLRKQIGLSQKEFADLISVSISTLRRWEQGVSSPSNLANEKLQDLEKAVKIGKKDDYLKAHTALNSNSNGQKDYTRDFSFNGQIHKAEYMPYVYNGPEDQVGFYNELIDLQQISQSDISWEQYQKRLSIIKSIDGQTTEQALLEKPSMKQKSWTGVAGAHGWHRYVGRFPAQVVRAIINAFDLGQDDLLLDPFCGSGTTLVEARLLGVPAIGVEISPLSAMISRVKSKFEEKTELLSGQIPLIEQFYQDKWKDFVCGKNLNEISYDEILARDGNPVHHFPNIERWFTKEALLGTSIIVEYIMLAAKEHKNLAEMLAVALSAKMRSIGNVDVDVVRAEYRKTPRVDVDVLKLVIAQLKKMINSINRMEASHKDTIANATQIEVIENSCQRVNIPDESISAIITSPPYGVESLSYLRTHLLSFRVLESLLGVDPYNFNAGVIGSEYIDKSIPNALELENAKISPNYLAFFSSLINNKDMQALSNRTYAMMQFFCDMDSLIKKFGIWLRPNGKVAFVIGNKKIGDFIIPTDKIIIDIFEKYHMRYTGRIAHKLKTNNSNSQVPWQDRIIENEFILFFEKEN